MESDESPSKPPRSSRGGSLGMIQGVVTTQPTVGVGWGDHPLAWLISYNGGDCRLWQYVYRKCMESELCGRAAELLPTIGYDLTRHRCLHP